MEILDCTLRDGANVVGLGFDRKLTEMIMEGLIQSGIRVIEFGNAHGMNRNEAGSPMTDEEYLALAYPYTTRAKLGMFIQKKAVTESAACLARQGGLHFLRIGDNAGNAEMSREAIRTVKAKGLSCRYSIMKVYLLSPQELVKEARILENFGADGITLMDSAGTMLPQEVKEYVGRVKEAVSIPIGFHGHNNLGLSAGNMEAALEAGADSIDTGLMGMARSAGNCATEITAAILRRKGIAEDIRLYDLLEFIEKKLEPEMEKYNYHNPLHTMDLMFGLTGCHSAYGEIIEQTACEYGVSRYMLMEAVSRENRKDPSIELIREKAAELKTS